MEILKSAQLLVETLLMGAERAASRVGSMAGTYMKGLFGLFVLVSVVPVPMLLVGIFGGLPWVTATAGLWWCFWTMVLFGAAAPIGMLIELLTGGASGSGQRYVRHAAGVLVTGLCFALFTALIPVHEHLTLLPILLLAALILAFLGSSLFSRRMIMFVVTLVFLGLLFSIFFPLTAKEVTERTRGLDNLLRERVREADFSDLKRQFLSQARTAAPPTASQGPGPQPPRAPAVAPAPPRVDRRAEASADEAQAPADAQAVPGSSAVVAAAGDGTPEGTAVHDETTSSGSPGGDQGGAAAPGDEANRGDSPEEDAGRQAGGDGASQPAPPEAPEAPAAPPGGGPPALVRPRPAGPQTARIPVRVVFAMRRDWPYLFLESVEIDDRGMLHLLFNISNPCNGMASMALVDQWRSTYLRVDNGEVLPLVRTLGIASYHNLLLRPGGHEMVTLSFAAPQQGVDSLTVVTRWSSRGCQSQGTRNFEKRISVKTRTL